jgi:hypothetical protein
MPTKKQNGNGQVKDQLMVGCAALAVLAFVQLNNTMKSEMREMGTTLKGHMDDCAEKSKTMVRVLIGVATLVAGELILKGLSFFTFVHGG